MALPYIAYKLGNGRDIYLLFDVWISGSSEPLINVLSDIPHELYTWHVSDIVDNGKWILKHQALQPAWSLITQQSTQSVEVPDTWKWKCTNTTKFSFSSEWNLVRDSEPHFQLANMIWYPSYNPKMSVCFLRALKSKLLTRDFLKSLNISDSDECVLCNTTQESIAHLFFACPFSAYLWALCRLKLGLNDSTIGSLQDEAILLQSKFRGSLSPLFLQRPI